MDLTLHCPQCQHEMQLRNARVGRFGPRCSACGTKFLLVVHPPESGKPVEVKPLPVGVAAGSASADSIAGLRSAAAPPDVTVPERATAQPPPSSQRRPHRPTSPLETAPPPATHAETAAPRPPRPAAAPDRRREATVPLPQGRSAPTAVEPPSPQPMPQSPVPDYDGSPDVDLQLGGYQVIRQLGQGGMGHVYLAKQLSLDRNVALKTLAPTLAADPSFVARFTREAYAAAQLTHHNVVQIYDIGIGKDTRAKSDVHFFSMEYVEGHSLSTTVGKTGRLDPEVAAGYVLQAARGLKFAHDHGLIHRDVKPDNLLLNDQGLVKVADLGLVKVAGDAEPTMKPRPASAESPVPTDVTVAQTQLNVSMGTPAYMPPEQARDAAHVDQRADIYSLGCTLYDLLTGHPPFQGRTALEVITKHSTEQLVPPDRVSRHVPPRLSAIVMKMTAKRPADRFQAMNEVVDALEKFLGVDPAVAINPQEQAVHELEDAVTHFNRSKWANVRDWIIRGFLAVCGLGAVLCALPKIGLFSVAAGFVGFALVTTLFYQLIVGVTQGTVLFKRFRQFLFGMHMTDWLRVLLFTAVTVLLLFVFKLLWVMLGFTVLALVAAAAFHFLMDKLVTAEREPALRSAEDMLRRMRIAGQDENALRQFVCKYAGERWEAFYEAMFGYEAKRLARRAWGKGDRGRDRKRHAAWRDPLIDLFDRRVAARHLERERRVLQKVEQRALTAKGLDEGKAAQEARKAAERFMRRASVVRDAAERRAAATAAPVPAAATAKPAWETSPAKSLTPNWIHNLAAQPLDDELPGYQHEGYIKRRYGGPLDVLFGRGVRFVLAAMLLAGFGMWVRDNTQDAAAEQISKTVSRAVDPNQIAKDKNITTGFKAEQVFKMSAGERKPLRVAIVPNSVCDAVGSWNGGLSGIVLLMSCVFVGKRYGVAVIVAAAAALFAHRVSIPVLQGQPLFSAAVSVVLFSLAVLFLRRRDE